MGVPQNPVCGSTAGNPVWGSTAGTMSGGVPQGILSGGVPQGILSGPKCFLVYIKRFKNTPVPLYKYVDDSTLFEICYRKAVSVIQESVDIAARWTLQNYMKINSGKSKEISYAQDGNVRNNIPNIKTDETDVDKVDHDKLLGVTMSRDLTWSKRVENIVKKQGKDYRCCTI